MLDMILCDYWDGEADTPAPELSGRSIDVYSDMDKLTLYTMCVIDVA